MSVDGVQLMVTVVSVFESNVGVPGGVGFSVSGAGSVVTGSVPLGSDSLPVPSLAVRKYW